MRGPARSACRWLTPLVLLLVAGCQAPQSVRDLASLTRQAVEASGAAHLHTLDEMERSLRRSREELVALQRWAEEHEQALSARERDLIEARRGRAVDAAMLEYDRRALELLQGPFDEALEEAFWPGIETEFEDIRGREARVGADLGDPPDPVRVERYRDLGVHRYDLARRAQAAVGDLRAEAIERMKVERERLRPVLEAAAGAEAAAPSAASAPPALDDAVADYDAVLDAIDDARGEVERMNRQQLDALDQVRAYLERPRAWRLVLQGVETRTNEIVRGYTDSVTGWVDESLDELQRRADALEHSLDLSEPVSAAIGNLEGWVDGAAEQARERIVTAADAAARPDP
jgi:hypothetical protein